MSILSTPPWCPSIHCFAPIVRRSPSPQMSASCRQVAKPVPNMPPSRVEKLSNEQDCYTQSICFGSWQIRKLVTNLLTLSRSFSLVVLCGWRPPRAEYNYNQNIGTCEIGAENFHVNENGVFNCMGNNVCAPMNSGNHKVFQNSKPYTEQGGKVIPLVDAAEEES